VQINNGWDPHHHQATDIYANFSDKDFRLVQIARRRPMKTARHAPTG
jgi:hypothetical protein